MGDLDTAHTATAITTAPARPRPATCWDPRRRIVLAAQGGIGNQLFQWAFGSALRSRGVDLVLDSVRCRGDRPLALGHLVDGWPRLARPVGVALAAVHRAGRRTPGIRTLTDTDLAATSDPITDASSPCYLVGYFQSPAWFAPVAGLVREQILQELRRGLTPAGARRHAELLNDPDTAAIHVRRGDYVTDAAAAATNGALGISYYEAAREELARRGLRRVMWFSDDVAWVREHLAGPEDVWCEPGLTKTDGAEIVLMAACRARVIANSSFSWWAGWLGAPATSDRPVIAPRRWFADPSLSAEELLLREWTVL